MSPAARAWGALFLLVSAVQIATEAVGAPGPGFVAKALLMPLLGAAFLADLGGRPTRLRVPLLVALAGSWVGDVALMLAPQREGDLAVLGIPKHDLWFLVGVAGFFAAHLGFLTAWARVDRPDLPPLARRAPLAFAPLALGLLFLGLVVVPGLWADPARRVAAVPVGLYGSLLVTMVGFALARQGRVDPTSFRLALVGATTFLVSDALIALLILRPEGALPYAGVPVMLTYLLAQALMVAGAARQVRAPLRG